MKLINAIESVAVWHGGGIEAGCISFFDQCLRLSHGLSKLPWRSRICVHP